jgi:PAS domain S-box-containing protein
MMQRSEKQCSGNLVSLHPWRITLCYVVAGLLWILFSDRLTESLFRDSPGMLMRVSSLKGVAFVLVTAGFLHLLLHRHIAAYGMKAHELQESLTCHNLVVENAPDAILIHDGERFIFVNTEAVRLFGAAAAEDIVGRRVLDCVHPDSRESVAERIRSFIEGKRSALPKEQHYLRLDGSSIDVEVSGVPFPLADRPGALVFVRDIGPRKAAERDLRESEAKYRLLADNAHDLIFTFDADWRPTFVSPSVERLRGMSVQEVMGQRFEEMLLPESAARARKAAARLARDTGPGASRVETLELELRRKDGGSVWVECVVRTLHDAAGTFQGVLGAGRDITERRRIEDDLRRSREFVTMILEAIPDPVFVKDSRHRFVMGNQALCAMLGKPAQEILGKSDSDFVAAAEADVFVSRDNLVLETGETDLFEERLTDSLGVGHVLVTRKGLFVDATGARFIVGVIRDVTEDRRNERRLRDSLLEKEVLLKEVHHRVKNNLQVISSLLFLQKDASEDPAIQVLFEESRNRIASMALIHEELYRSGDLARVDLKDYLERLTPKLVQSLRGDKGIGFSLELVECPVTVDKAIPFGLIVNELVTNAVKHAFVGRDTGIIRVRVSREDDMVRAAVEDDGVGLGEDFHPERSKSLGMQLVVQLSRQLRGALTFGSGPSGTAFRLSFPVSETAS